jgi:hypothetical protein
VFPTDGVTVIEVVVAPVDQLIVPDVQAPFKITDAPLQILLLPFPPTETLGAVGVSLIVAVAVTLFAPAVSQPVVIFLHPT